MWSSPSRDTSLEAGAEPSAPGDQAMTCTQQTIDDCCSPGTPQRTPQRTPNTLLLLYRRKRKQTKQPAGLADAVPAEAVTDDAVPAEAVTADAVPAEDMSAEAVPAEDMSAEAVAAEAVAAGAMLPDPSAAQHERSTSPATPSNSPCTPRKVAGDSSASTAGGMATLRTQPTASSKDKDKADALGQPNCQDSDDDQRSTAMKRVKVPEEGVGR